MSSTLLHDLTPHFPEFAQFHSTPDLESSQLYQELLPEIERVLEAYEYGEYAAPAAPKSRYRVVAWNIERGTHFQEIVEILKKHPELSRADIYLITEADLGMARSHNRNIAQELAEALQLNYFFAPSYLNLSKGCGHEAEYDGENTLGIHGNAILSRYPLTNFRTVKMPNGKDKMKGREKRIGHQRALVCDIALGDRQLTTACIHLDAHSTRHHRVTQMNCVLDSLREVPKDQATLIGGDWNTSTYNSHRAVSAIIGFWVRIAMGVDNMICNHYPHPDRFWEKKLFERLKAEGFNLDRWNEVGEGTLVYDIKDPNQFKNLREWIPNFCFRFIEWSLREHNGICGFKLDWLAGRNVTPSNPRVIDGLYMGNKKVSDHEAIMADFKMPS